MQIDFEKMTSHELARIIKAASSELERRLNDTPIIERTPAPRTVITVQEPPATDKDFVLALKAALQSGNYATAAERRRCAEIAEKYPSWVRSQGMPTTHNAGDWNRSRQNQSRPRAKER